MQQVSLASGACSLASVESKRAKKKRKTCQNDTDEAEDISQSDTELGERSTVYHCQCDALIVCVVYASTNYVWQQQAFGSFQ